MTSCFDELGLIQSCLMMRKHVNKRKLGWELKMVLQIEESSKWTQDIQRCQ